MIVVKTGPAFGELRTLEEQLEASAFLLKPGTLPDDAALESVHAQLDLACEPELDTTWVPLDLPAIGAE